MTVQQRIEDGLSTLLRGQIELVGCGRTDAGVHAKGYTAHFDAGEIANIEKLVHQLNAILPDDISVQALLPADPEFHARYDAIRRYYDYHIHFLKDPFQFYHSFYLNRHVELNKEAMQGVAATLLEFEEFLPFCKTGSDNMNYKCQMFISQWIFDDTGCHYSISANRFLRGMVRLIVGAALNAGYGKITVAQVRECLEQQKALPIQWSVPAKGLCLTYCEYP